MNDIEVALTNGTKRIMTLNHTKGRNIEKVRELSVSDIDVLVISWIDMHERCFYCS